MSRLSRPLLAVALLALATIARADSPRLLAPAQGATLRGGSYAELRWSAAPLPAATEEWEAFLSIDGGKYYAFRVTPHLDIELRRFTFVVPNVDTHDARILIRTGDEVQETHFEIPGSFSIVRDPNAEQIAPRLLQLGRGEAAREGDPAVLSWTEGARNGSGVSQQSSPAVPLSSLGGLIAIASDVSAVLSPAAHRVAAPAVATTWRSSPGRQTVRAEPPPRSVDLLLVCRRRNI
ncbi:MAG: hypothetical protein JWN02_2208 [Acidobacteria bacterium]|nr:hypothetical protein [Acidobacteriota bacterium]